MQEAIEKVRLLPAGEDVKPTTTAKRKDCGPYVLPTVTHLWTIFLILSLCLNCTLFWLFALERKHHEYNKSSDRSEHGQPVSSAFLLSILRCLTARKHFLASLSKDLIDPYYEETSYSDSTNESLAATLWHNIDIDSGVIALSDDYVASKNLLPAQRFPWDVTKGIYIVHGYHNLHCLVQRLLLLMYLMLTLATRKLSISLCRSIASGKLKAENGPMFLTALTP